MGIVGKVQHVFDPQPARAYALSSAILLSATTALQHCPLALHYDAALRSCSPLQAGAIL